MSATSNGEEYSFEWQVEGRSGTQLLHLCLPHHLETLTNSVQTTTITATSQTKGQKTTPSDGQCWIPCPTSGPMKGVVGNTWTFREGPLEDLPFMFPSDTILPPRMEEIRAILTQEIDAFNVDTETQKGSWYFSGKGMQKLSYLCLVADELMGR